jgi:hypothetical protein
MCSRGCCGKKSECQRFIVKFLADISVSSRVCSSVDFMAVGLHKVLLTKCCAGWLKPQFYENVTYVKNTDIDGQVFLTLLKLGHG